MPRYKCKAKDMEGNVYKGVMEAADERVLLKVLRDKAYTALNAAAWIQAWHCVRPR